MPDQSTSQPQNPGTLPYAPRAIAWDTGTAVLVWTICALMAATIANSAMVWILPTDTGSSFFDELLECMHFDQWQFIEYLISQVLMPLAGILALTSGLRALLGRNAGRPMFTMAMKIFITLICFGLAAKALKIIAQLNVSAYPWRPLDRFLVDLSQSAVHAYPLLMLVVLSRPAAPGQQFRRGRLLWWLSIAFAVAASVGLYFFAAGFTSASDYGEYPEFTRLAQMLIMCGVFGMYLIAGFSLFRKPGTPLIFITWACLLLVGMILVNGTAIFVCVNGLLSTAYARDQNILNIGEASLNLCQWAAFALTTLVALNRKEVRMWMTSNATQR